MDVIVVTTLKELREVRKITLKELAGSLGVTVAQASYLENGKQALSLDKPQRWPRFIIRPSTIFTNW